MVMANLLETPGYFTINYQLIPSNLEIVQIKKALYSLSYAL